MLSCDTPVGSQIFPQNIASMVKLYPSTASMTDGEEGGGLALEEVDYNGLCSLVELPHKSSY